MRKYPATHSYATSYSPPGEGWGEVGGAVGGRDINYSFTIYNWSETGIF
jgi:hypothetical protein